MAVEVFTKIILDSYLKFMNLLPDYVRSFLNIFLLILLVVIYAVLVWKFYKFIGKKNLFSLNFSKYNTSEHPVFAKLLAGFLYFLEYIIVLPFLVFIWFAGFSTFLILLSNNLEVQTILFLSVTIIGAIRMISYIPRNGEEIAQEIAKIIPYTLLAVFILNPEFFDFSRVLSQLGTLPKLYSNIFLYIAFIFGLELVLRFFDIILRTLGLHDDKAEDENNENIVK